MKILYFANSHVLTAQEESEVKKIETLSEIELIVLNSRFANSETIVDFEEPDFVAGAVPAAFSDFPIFTPPELPTVREIQPVMLGEYVQPDMPGLPPQLLPDPEFATPAAWTAANGWAIGSGIATKSGDTYARLTPLNLPLPPQATDLAMIFEVVAQTSNSAGGGSGGVRATVAGNNSNQRYLGLRSPQNTRLQVSHIRNRTPAQNNLQFDATNTWQGSIGHPRLYDVSAYRNMPTLVVPNLGQSNRVGFGDGYAVSAKDGWHPCIWMCPPLDYTLYGAIANTVTLAQEPLVHSADFDHRVGPAMAMARRLVALTNGEVRVVIVPCARTATGLLPAGAAGGWNPDTTATLAENRYATAVTAVLAARAQITNYIGTLMLWSGNEADMTVANGAAKTPGAMANMITRMRADFNAPDMPVVMSGAVIADRANPSATVVMQRNMDEHSGAAGAIKGVTYYDRPSGPGTINAGDAVHFTTETLRISGDYEGQIAYNIGIRKGWW